MGIFEMLSGSVRASPERISFDGPYTVMVLLMTRQSGNFYEPNWISRELKRSNVSPSLLRLLSCSVIMASERASTPAVVCREIPAQQLVLFHGHKTRFLCPPELGKWTICKVGQVNQRSLPGQPALCPERKVCASNPDEHLPGITTSLRAAETSRQLPPFEERRLLSPCLRACERGCWPK